MDSRGSRRGCFHARSGGVLGRGFLVAGAAPWRRCLGEPCACPVPNLCLDSGDPRPCPPSRACWPRSRLCGWLGAQHLDFDVHGQFSGAPTVVPGSSCLPPGRALVVPRPWTASCVGDLLADWARGLGIVAPESSLAIPGSPDAAGKVRGAGVLARHSGSAGYAGG